jgi:hypothetical protein
MQILYVCSYESIVSLAVSGGIIPPRAKIFRLATLVKIIPPTCESESAPLHTRIYIRTQHTLGLLHGGYPYRVRTYYGGRSKCRPTQYTSVRGRVGAEASYVGMPKKVHVYAQ